MKVLASEIKAMNSPFLRYITGNLSAEAYRPWPPKEAPPSSLVYVSTPEQFEDALAAPAGIIIATKNAYHESGKLTAGQALFETPSISAAMALLNSKFDTKAQRWPAGISPQAVIHPSAQLGSNVSIGAFSVIGEGVVIGDKSRIGPNCVLEKEAKIGASTLLHALIYVGANCEIGSSCEIHPHTTIGSDGFGYATDEKNINHKIPQLGIVVIEDRVEIGANCAIDRATLTETRIGEGTKFDNHIHMAHNCKFGKNGLFTAGFATAGSTEIGDNFKCGGVVAVSDHIKITDNVTLGGRSTVTKDITTPGAYTGYPVEPFRDGLRTLASLPSLTEMRKQLIELRKHLGLDKS